MREAGNTVYWLMSAGDYGVTEFMVLRMVRDEKPKRTPWQFETAFLIAMECLSFDGDRLGVTEKGLDCLDFFGEEGKLDA
jgi:hypothetical protein